MVHTSTSRISIAIAFFIILALVAPLAHSYSSGASIIISLISQDPDPAEPGKYTDLRFKIENNGIRNMDEVTLELIPSYPFSLDPQTSAERYIGTIWGSETGSEGIVVLYKVRVDKMALTGTSHIKMRYRTPAQDWVTTDDFDVAVKTSDNTIAIESVTTYPEPVAPGETAQINIALKNLADIDFKDISVKIDLSSSSMPFAPLNSATEKRIKLLSSGSNANVTFSIIASADAESQFYKVPLLINYSDLSNNKYYKTEIVTVLVGGEPDIVATLDSTDIYSTGKSGTVVLKFINRGAIDVKFLYIRILPDKNYDVFSNSEAYVGKLDSDDYQTAEFKMYIRSAENGIVTIPVAVEYQDANNKKYERIMNIELKTYSTAELKRYGLSQGNSIVGILIFVLIVAGGIFLYRRWKKKGRK